MDKGFYLKSVKVGSYSGKDSTVTLEVTFNDGQDKSVFKTTKVDSPENLSRKILSEIMNLERNISREFDGKDILGDTNVSIHNKEALQKKLANFLNNIQTKILQLQNKKDANGYLSLISDLQAMELNLEHLDENNS